MSWSLQYANRAAFEENRPIYIFTDVSDDAAEQIDAARSAAKALIDSRSVVNGAQDCGVSISGHANPLHLPKSGWANDCITVTINQLSPPKVDDVAPVVPESEGVQSDG